MFTLISADRELQLKPEERIPTLNPLYISIPSLCISSNVYENDVGKLLFPLAISASHSVCCLSSMVQNKSGQLRFILSCSEFYFLTYLI